jgi:DNA-binding response OmpR family regulator
MLLVEPDRKLARTYAQYFEAHGHKVVISSAAQPAISAADQQAPDVVILELQLVAHSGVEFLHEFRSYGDWRSIPIIVHSHVSPQEFLASQKLLKLLGVAAYHYKPRTSLHALLQSVEEVVAHEPA